MPAESIYLGSGSFTVFCVECDWTPPSIPLDAAESGSIGREHNRLFHDDDNSLL